MKLEIEEIKRRLFRMEWMMYFVVAKLGVDEIRTISPTLLEIWRALW